VLPSFFDPTLRCSRWAKWFGGDTPIEQSLIRKPGRITVLDGEPLEALFAIKHHGDRS
jgi:hypothetical protein